MLVRSPGFPSDPETALARCAYRRRTHRTLSSSGYLREVGGRLAKALGLVLRTLLLLSHLVAWARP